MNRLALPIVFLIGLLVGWIGKSLTVRPSPPKPIATTAPIPQEATPEASPIPADISFRTNLEPRIDFSDPDIEPEITLPLLAALQDGSLSLEVRGNAHDRLRVTGINRTDKALRVTLPAGQSFESANGYVVIPREVKIDFRPGQTRLETLGTLATASTNTVETITFVATPTQHPRLSELLAHLTNHPEVPLPAAQTAALVILENLPANAFARFAPVGGNDLPSQWDTEAFKVDTVDLIRALLALRQMGLPDEQLAITIDPQTKIEAMIDPMAHALALQYYGIKDEWAYWRDELLKGAPGTRHYALHGIARYYPETAVKMLPQWVREKRTRKVFRVEALRALAQTKRPDALPVLHALAEEVKGDPELAQTAKEAILYLENLGKEEVLPVQFRLNGAPAQ